MLRITLADCNLLHFHINFYFLLLFLWEDSTTALTAISPEVSTAFDRMTISQVTVLSHWSHFVFWCL